MTLSATELRQQHDALHLAHRWFAFFEAPGRALEPHLEIFSHEVRLSGHQGRHVFADDRQSLADWFDTVPDERSAHHILHATFEPAPPGQSLLNMLVAYQAERSEGVRGAIIRYETHLSHDREGARFRALDKTPILPDTRAAFEPSWAANRVLALVHATQAGHSRGDPRLRAVLSPGTSPVQVRADAAEGSTRYQAMLNARAPGTSAGRTVLLDLEDGAGATVPRLRSLVRAGAACEDTP